MVWGPFFKGDILAIEKVQRRATKMVSRLNDLKYEERLQALNLPSLSHRRRRGDMIYAYKLITGKINMDKDKFFKISHLSTRGHEQKIYKEHAIKLPRINTFSNRGVRDWNNLTSEIVTAVSTNAFKNKLDNYWKDMIYDTPF